VRVRPEDGDQGEGLQGEDGAAGPRQPLSSAKRGGGLSAGAPIMLSECLCSSLDSIQGLAAEVDAGCHAGLAELMRGHVFVGMVSMWAW